MFQSERYNVFNKTALNTNDSKIIQSIELTETYPYGMNIDIIHVKEKINYCNIIQKCLNCNIIQKCLTLIKSQKKM